MLQSKLFPRSLRESPKDAESINHKLLVRGGFIDQLMAGSWTLLPLGWRVIDKIERVIREELTKIGAQEMLMPLLHPKGIWNETGRWDKADVVMYKLKDLRGKEYALSFTHEEIVMDIIRKHLNSYQDLPISIYHFSTKFRNEPRAKSGILRGREFLMKDLYSIHVSEEDLMKYYEVIKGAYSNIFKKLGFEFKVVEASGGVFTDQHTHEFQVLSESGEDTIYYCDKCNWGQNKEIFVLKAGDKCPSCKEGKIVESKSIEIGNIFPLGTFYSERMRVYYSDSEGMKKPVWFGSYGIGITRVMGTWVEISNDDKGIIWNKALSPFDIHLIELPGAVNAKEIYEKLKESSREVLWDDRDLPAGHKFSDADLIGIPIRLVVSEKTGDKIEWKERNSEGVELLDLEEVLNRVKF